MGADYIIFLKNFFDPAPLSSQVIFSGKFILDTHTPKNYVVENGPKIFEMLDF